MGVCIRGFVLICVYKHERLCGYKCMSLHCSPCLPASVCVAVSLSDVPVCASMSVLCVYVQGAIFILCVCVCVCVGGQCLYKRVGFNPLA